MKTLQRQLGKLLKWGTLLSTLGFVASTLIQIYARFFMAKAPSWTEEAARLFFIFAIGCASGLAMRGSYYVHFDFLYEKLPSKLKSLIMKAIYVLIVLLFVIFTYHSLQFVMDGWIEKSPSLRFPMAVAFIGVTIMGLAISYYAITKLISLFKK
ncbi:TRAP transporter small permease [Flagellimonas algicola]|uniref:TRAP transporter small permease n=1 Tax=Flagellimonas algicola TaxID=2583815 RepID=A0ABY2WQU2_9FLAO|nr:TRAP transporter small permease [Allomuricauda algicola]TMU57026.1 TRAP transporter small permease [Allomuricauda algicola]